MFFYKKTVDKLCTLYYNIEVQYFFIRYFLQNLSGYAKTRGNMPRFFVKPEFIEEDYSWIQDRTLDKFINEELLYESISRINKISDDKIITQAINTIKRIDNPSLFERNFKFHKYLIDGITIESKDYKVNPLLKLLDFENPENNTFQVCHQVKFNEGRNTRIPDVIVYINGLPFSSGISGSTSSVVK